MSFDASEKKEHKADLFFVYTSVEPHRSNDESKNRTSSSKPRAIRKIWSFSALKLFM
jgi:hypothetical protein